MTDATQTRPAWKLHEKARNVHVIEVEVARRADWEFWCLLTSDWHWDHPKCRRELLRRHLDQAVERNAPIICAGDLYCAMQGKYDPRADKSKLRPEHQCDKYLDALVDTAADWLQPYAQHLAVIGEGNHETNIAKRHETDLLDRLTGLIRRSGGIARKGGYGGYIRFHWNTSSSRRFLGTRLYYHHDTGGGAPVTKGQISFNRYAENHEADIYLSGHIHRQNHNKHYRTVLSKSDLIERRRVDYVRTPTYKDDYDDGVSGFHVIGRHGPRPLGAYWLRFYYESPRPRDDRRGKIDAIRRQIIEAED